MVVVIAANFPNNREINREFFFEHAKKPHRVRVFAIPMHQNREFQRIE